MSRWTLEQAAELCLEQALDLLDGCADDDAIRPGLVMEALRRAWAPGTRIEPLECTAGEMRTRVMAARKALAEGALIPHGPLPGDAPGGWSG